MAINKLLSRNNKETKAKYQAYLVAYKGLTKEGTSEILKHCISFINDEKDIQRHAGIGPKGSGGLDFRVSIYHRDFANDILDQLNNGYSLGIVETKIGYDTGTATTLKELDNKHGDKINIVAETKL